MHDAMKSTGRGSAGNAVDTMPQVEERGLGAQDVQERVGRDQTNLVDNPTSRSLAQIIRSNVFTLFNGIIFVAMLMVMITGSWRDSVFGLVIIVNTGIGIITELRAKRTLDRLSILVASHPLVRREGRNIEIDHDDIVLDDLLWIRSGEQVPADAEILRSWGLELDESMLTGESNTVRKQPGDSAYSGSNAVSGLALAKVSAVGQQSYAAKLTAQAKVYTTTVSDLNRGINKILEVLTFLVVPLCALLIWSQVRAVGGWSAAISGGQWRQAVVSAVAGVVGMIPEGLVLLTSLNFAIAAMRLARKNTLVQELEAVETLARVDCLNLDKTGTITDGGIEFKALLPVDGVEAANGDETAETGKAVDALGVHSDAGNVGLDTREVTQALFDLANEENPNATGRAVLDALSAQGYESGQVDVRMPFSSARKWSAIARQGDGIWYFGAPEVLLSAFAQAGEGARISGFAALSAKIAEYANHGNRVLLIAHRAGDIPADFDAEPHLDPHALPVALVLCAERVRDDAADTLLWFREQGVRCRVISGDNPATVGAIATQVRLCGDNPVRTMDARELPEDTAKLAQVLDKVDVLGRVMPEQKKAIVQALHRDDHVVAMTGDGVNDTLAIKEADLGIAMGNAAPATKAVAQVVLVDSKFSHLPDVVARGRQVMANMERVASLFLVKTAYSIIISLGVVLTGILFPYLPRHITYIGALTIGMPAFVLALAPNTRRYIPGFLRRVITFSLPSGIAIGVSVLLSSWFLPGIMQWDMHVKFNQRSLFTINAIIVFALGIVVLAQVARPLLSWRGALVALFAAAGIIGAFIPFVAGFFALQLPSGGSLVATLAALAIALLILATCQFIANLVRRNMLGVRLPRDRRMSRS
ncbi:HAD-IC family P-type ATPase [Bifidobacterium subtile]|jgi:cation-transporting ATPase E|uniref:HAD-IC family P-type ATPase n=1 Tax=Bifidobacterium subtile TaxID=77635 RepID=UPI002F350D37